MWLLIRQPPTKTTIVIIRTVLAAINPCQNLTQHQARPTQTKPDKNNQINGQLVNFSLEAPATQGLVKY
ncbi:hypothetical protein RRG08_006963 [Elysia crispata]|uniref:Uncharacterized protein n=1 Tax=Elysia crispata TaxID=231223 RepID=A0AAE1D9J8_9GAST|nr:hypothetical protein RRG08_006963 [Elysia crispata]